MRDLGGAAVTDRAGRRLLGACSFFRSSESLIYLFIYLFITAFQVLGEKQSSVNYALSKPFLNSPTTSASSNSLSTVTLRVRLGEGKYEPLRVY